MHQINNISCVEKELKYLYTLVINGKNYEFLSINNEQKDLNEQQRNKFIEKCNNEISLFSFEGTIVPISWKQGFMSGLIKNIFLIDSEVTKIPLSTFNIDHETLIKIKVYLEHYENINPKEIRREPLITNKLRDIVEEWDYNFINIDDKDKLFSIHSAACYMDIDPLVSLSSVKIASLLKGTTTEEIREEFNIKNDFTPEEEQQIIEENSWSLENL